jgi:23S rRNA pseudouridine1911/1915/1917 synthase
LIREGCVFVDDAPARTAASVERGRTVRVLPLPLEEAAVRGADADLVPRVLWQSAELIVLDKPAGLHTHAGRSGRSVAAFLANRYPELRAVGVARVEAGLVHRLDRDTSGVVLAAPTTQAYAALREAFAAHRVAKDYLALVTGRVERVAEIDVSLARRRTRVVAARRRDRSLDARTVVTPLQSGASWSLVRVAIDTGVTHQVRAHLAMLGHALLGDEKYGGPTAPPGTRTGQLLHAQRIVLDDGRSFAAAAPADFCRALALLRRGG